MSSESSHPNNQIILILLGACANHTALLCALAHDSDRSGNSKDVRGKPIADIIRVVANMKPRATIACELYRGISGSEQSKKRKGLADCWKQLCESDTTEWHELQTWKFVDGVMAVFAAVKADGLPWSTVWNKVRPRLRKCTPPGNIEWMYRELNERFQRLQGKNAPHPAVLPAVAEQGQQNELENIRTLSELCEWLKQRLRWVRDWHKGQLTPAFRDAIVAMFRSKSIFRYPSDPSNVDQWAKELVWRFSVITIHHAHDWLETHNVFGAPEWRTPDLIKDEYAQRNPVEVEHLSALLNFAGIRAGVRSELDANTEGERGEGTGADSDPADGEQAEEVDKDAESGLTDRQKLILETMLEHEITSERRRKTRRKIVQLINRTHNPSSYSRDFARLTTLQYLRSLEGPKGGVWMTLTGKAAAQRYRSSN